MENAIARPWDEGTVWEHGNQHMVDIPGIGVIYDPCAMNRTLADLRLGETAMLDITDAGVEASVNDAYTHSRLYFDSSGAFCADCRVVYIPAMSFPFIAIELGTMHWRFTDMRDIRCMYYMLSLQEHRQNWKSAMNSALDALELSIEKADESVNMARSGLAALNHMGICDDDYKWQPHEVCANLSEAIMIVDSGVPEGNYGKYGILQAYRHNISEAVWGDIPNMTLYHPAMELVWAGDGVAGAFNQLSEAGKDAKEEAEGIYGQYRDGADAAKRHADEGCDGLEENKLEKIDAAVALSSPDVSRIGTIAERYGTISDEKENADKAYENAAQMFSDEWMQGYLKYATAGMASAMESYEAIEADIDLLLEDAQEVVDDARSGAEGKIREAESRENTMGSAGKEKLQDARDAFAKSGRAGALGDKYVYYIEAAGLASAALGEKSFEQEADVQLKIAEIGDLLDRAEQDGINVAGERAELEMLSNNRGLPDILQRFDSLKERIIGKAEIVFGGLESEHDALLEKLMLADTENADDLIEEMQDAEQGIATNGKIDYENGLGRLAWLRSQYDSIEEKLEEDMEAMNDIVANSIVADASLVVGRVKIDEPTDIVLNVLFKNMNDYAGEDVEVAVPLQGKFRFGYFDITEGADEVSGLDSGNSGMTIALKSIEPYETKSITFEKSDILARMISEEENAYGLGDGSALVEKSTVFELDVDDAYMEFPEASATDAYIDGISANRPLSKGMHTLARSYVVEEAYGETRSGATTSSAAMETTVSYTITIAPNMDLDSVPLILDVAEGGQVSEISVFCVEYDFSMEGTKVEVFSLMEDSPATVQVSYVVSDLPEYVASELEMLEGAGGENEVKALISEARTLYAAGDYEAALRKIEEAKKRISGLDKENSKLLREYAGLTRGISRELEDLDSAIGNAELLNVSDAALMDRFRSRKKELSGILAEMENISSASAASELQDAVDRLGEVDEGWLKKQVTAFRNDATKQLNDYRKDFAEFGNASADGVLETLEHDINVLAATEKAESAVAVLGDLKTAENLLGNLENSQKAATDGLRLDFESLKEETEAVLSAYSAEAKNAKDTSIGQLFTFSSDSAGKLISDIEKNIGAKGNDYVEKKMKDLEKAKKNMEEILGEAKSQAKGRLASIQSVYSEKKDSLPEADRSFVSDEIAQIEQLISAGHYADAISKGDAVTARINSAQKGNNNFLFLLLASVLVLAMVIAYIIRQQHGKKPGMRLDKESESGGSEGR